MMSKRDIDAWVKVASSNSKRTDKRIANAKCLLQYDDLEDVYLREAWEKKPPSFDLVWTILFAGFPAFSSEKAIPLDAWIDVVPENTVKYK